MVITIGAHWSPLELEIEKRDKAEPIQTVIQGMANLTRSMIVIAVVKVTKNPDSNR